MVLLTFAFLMFELNDNAVKPVKIQTAKYITAKFN